ncbi:hypothetical protein WAI453_009892 [Rhynchosporium graminicola]
MKQVWKGYYAFLQFRNTSPLRFITILGALRDAISTAMLQGRGFGVFPSMSDPHIPGLRPLRTSFHFPSPEHKITRYFNRSFQNRSLIDLMSAALHSRPQEEKSLWSEFQCQNENPVANAHSKPSRQSRPPPMVP